MRASYPSRCPCGEPIEEGDEIHRNADDTAWCCALCGFTGVRKKAAVDMPNRDAPCIACAGTGYYDDTGSPPCAACGGTGKKRRGTVMQTIEARRRRAREKR